MFRIAFDPALPVVAAQPFTAAGRSIAAKEPVDWRALGGDERMLYDWWCAGLVSFLPAPAQEPEPAPAPLVETPPQRPARKKR